MFPKRFLNFTLLFILVFSFHWRVILTNQDAQIGVNYLFPFIFLLSCYLLVEIADRKDRFNLKPTIFCLLLLLSVGSMVLSQIIARRQSGPEFYIHDGALQVEEAISYFLAGKNPYLETYIGTPLEKWGYGDRKPNPALYHLAYLPFVFLSAIPFYSVSMFFLDWFDIRFVYGLCFIGVLWLIYKMTPKKEGKMFFATLFALNPLFVFDFIEGYNDIFVLFWLMLTVYLLKKNKLTLSSIPLGFALASKQSAWFLFPFYFFYIFNKIGEVDAGRRIIRVLKAIWPLFVTCLFIVTPFFIWEPRAFFDDVYRYLNGSLPTSYPIKGLGFSVWLWSAGFVESRFVYFPFWIFQALICFPLMVVFLKRQRVHNTLYQMMANYAVFLGAFWLFSRFFNPNYLGYLSSLFLISSFLDT